MGNINTNLINIRKQIIAAETAYGRAPHSVQLLAASKAQPIEAIQEAMAAGQFAFGENYIQEALVKISALSDPRLEWHFIGKIQSNKLKAIAQSFHWVHTLTNLEHAKKLNSFRPTHLPSMNVCIEVNIDNETSKSGIVAADVLALAHEINNLSQLKLRGLMAIPTPQENFAEQRKPFHRLQKLLHNLQKQGVAADTLSMGMTNDFNAAIAEGATIIRVGTAIFGPRSK